MVWRGVTKLKGYETEDRGKAQGGAPEIKGGWVHRGRRPIEHGQVLGG